MNTEQASLGLFLTKFRKQCFLSTTDVANILGVNEKLIRQWEYNKSKPSEYQKDFLSYLYKMPTEFFTCDYSDVTKFNVSARMAVADTECFSNLSDVDKFYYMNKALSCYSLLQEVSSNQSEKKIENAENNQGIPIFNQEYADMLNHEFLPTMASHIRETFFGKKTGVLSDDLLEFIMDKLGFVSFADLPENVNGLAFYSINDEKIFIYINQKDSYIKQTFTLLHELGHIIFHSNKSATLPEEEDLVNYFANLILLPQDDMREYFGKIEKNNFCVEDWIETIKQVSQKYNASYKTILYSLNHLGLINGNKINDYANDIINKLFLGHAFSTKAGLEVNQLLNSAIVDMINDGDIAKDKALMLMNNNIIFEQ